MKKIARLKLNEHCFIPVLGLGTWLLAGEECKQVVRKAIELGYRHIDTAEIYENQVEIGEAIKGFDRSELFITSKVWHENLRYGDVLRACESTLKELGTDYLDLYLIHFPDRAVPMRETFGALKKLYEEEKVRSVGVSNFTQHHMEDALDVAEIPITVNQVEFHPYLYQKGLLEYCQKQGIVVTAYCPLGRGRILQDQRLRTLAENYQKSPAQISLKWLLQKGLVVIPKASSKYHLRENMDIFEWELSEEDVAKIDSIKIRERIVDLPYGDFDY